jgi:capsular polysaccharide biosynthesis protein
MSGAPSREDKPTGPASGGPSIWLQLAAAFAVFLVLSAGYSFIRDYMNQRTKACLSRRSQLTLPRENH